MMVINAMLCRLHRDEDEGFPRLNMLFAKMDELEIGWFSPAEKIGLKGLWVHWHQMAFYGFDDGVPF
ncbi:hypothetical protein [Erwinia sp. HR93]|uniref:hypothetical protein n=1 Tax=Erwinia sp. HR93 TaxID=3094840 RepID=UPI002ADEBBE0|nr:hypothetical protein [Erwinia sp. HR93]MEA1062758.1 hypothetical protein [Erwinia sp. HR93]